MIGITTRTIEQLKIDWEDLFEKYNFVTYVEYISKKFDPSKETAIVDSPAKLLLVNGLKIIDLKYKNRCYEMVPISKELIISELENNKGNVEALDLQHKIVLDFDLGEHSYLAHLNEYHQSFKPFLQKIHNILTKSQKEVINCLPCYKEKMKENLFNSSMAGLYKDFLDKKKGDYPALFKFMRLQTSMSYDEEEGDIS